MAITALLRGWRSSRTESPEPRLGAPHLFGEEPELMQRVFADSCRRYFEFGIGGSTLLALRSGSRSSLRRIPTGDGWRWHGPTQNWRHGLPPARFAWCTPISARPPTGGARSGVPSRSGGARPGISSRPGGARPGIPSAPGGRITWPGPGRSGRRSASCRTSSMWTGGSVSPVASPSWVVLQSPPMGMRSTDARWISAFQAAIGNSSATKRAWASMSRAPTFLTCPFLIIAITS
jgi:hypothetical protein